MCQQFNKDLWLSFSSSQIGVYEDEAGLIMKLKFFIGSAKVEQSLYYLLII